MSVVNIADIAIVVVFVLSMGIGLVRGFVVEVMAIVVWMAAVALAHWFGPVLATQFSNSVELSSARIFLGYGLIFVGALVAGAILIYFLKKLVAGTGLSGTDRLFGMLFGAVRGVVLTIVSILMLGLTPFPGDAWWGQSRAIGLFQPLAQRARAWLPEAVANKIRFEAGTFETPAPETGAGQIKTTP
jgi:membrane protein required for colicin V production